MASLCTEIKQIAYLHHSEPVHQYSADRSSLGTLTIIPKAESPGNKGLYGCSPIGFAYPTDIPSIEHELTNFNARLILAMLGVKNTYTKSTVDTRQYYGFDL